MGNGVKEMGLENGTIVLLYIDKKRNLCIEK